MFQTKFYLVQFLTNIGIYMYIYIYIYIHISNRKNVDNLYHLYLSIYMHQNTRMDLCHMRCQPLFHEKKLKRAISSA